MNVEFEIEKSCTLSNSYITGGRDVWHFNIALKSEGTCPRVDMSINAMHPECA